MKYIRSIRRANVIDRYAERQSSVVGSTITAQSYATVKGTPYRMGRRRCDCGRWHWNTKDRWCIGGQKAVAKLCPDCFGAKYKKIRPPQYRFLSIREISGMERELEASGVRVSYVDPSTL